VVDFLYLVGEEKVMEDVSGKMEDVLRKYPRIPKGFGGGTPKNNRHSRRRERLHHMVKTPKNTEDLVIVVIRIIQTMSVYRVLKHRRIPKI
jgi:hypothetical protein